MSTYDNAYDLLKAVRIGVNDYSEEKVQGTDTTGPYRNSDIMRKINDSQRYLFGVVVNRDPTYFYKSATLTPVNSVVSLPQDCYRLRLVTTQYGDPMTPIDLQDKQVSSGSSYLYYHYGKSIVVNAEGFSDPVVVYYVGLPPDLDSGAASAGGVGSVTLASTAKKINDYYNGLTIENITTGEVDTISDYTDGRVCTVSNTWSNGHYYGLVSTLPQPLHSLIAEKAVLLMRSSYPSLDRPSAKDELLFRDHLGEVVRALLGTGNTDTIMREMFI